MHKRYLTGTMHAAVARASMHVLVKTSANDYGTV